MTDLETRLQRAIKAGDSAPRDAMFRIDVLVRRERSLFRRRLLAAVATASAAAILGVLLLGAAGSGPTLLAAATGVALTLLAAVPHAYTLSTLRDLAARWRIGIGHRLWF